MAAERMDTEKWTPPWIRYAHLCRYAWAAERAADKDIIDAACGTGYGTQALLAAGARSLRGFDVSEEAIAAASKLVRSERVTLQKADITKLPLDKAACDLFVSFETIEHVDDDRAYVAEIARVLRPEGVFLCSTPNREVTNPGTSLTARPYNPFHIREYSQPELEAVLKTRFQEITWYGQGFFSSAWRNLLTRVSVVNAGLAVRVHQIRKLLGVPWQRQHHFFPRPLKVGQEPETLVAVCRFRRA